MTNHFRGLLDSNYGPHTYVYMSDRWDSLNGTGYWMVGPVDDLSDESFLEDAARSYNMDQVSVDMLFKILSKDTFHSSVVLF